MSKEFLYTLLDSMSVSGHEIPLQKKVIAEMTPHCDKIITDYTGNVVCVLNPDAPFKVMLAAHIDEIGLIVTHIQPDGLLRVSKSGGIFPGVYPGHQVAVHGYAQTVYGAVVRSKDMDKADLKADELYIDIGAKDAADAIVTAIERVLASGENLTRDMGGTASTSALGQAIADAVSVHPLETRRHG